MPMKSLLRASVLLLMLLSLPAIAQVVSSKGMATLTYERKLDAEVRRDAMRRANLAALETYVAETWLAKTKVFASRRDEMAGKLDRLILGSTVLNESEDKKSKTYSVVVRAEINAALLRAELDGGSATATAPPAQRSLLAMLFVARMQDSVQTFQDRQFNRADIKVKSDSSGRYTERTQEGESIGAAGIGTSGSITRTGSGRINESVVAETGGSTTRKADKVAWKITNASDINTTMSGVFSGAGYEVVEAEYVEAESGGKLSVERIRKDFSEGDDLSPAVLRATTDGVKHADIPLLAVGTLDVGMRDTDPVSGKVRVHVTVTGKVLDVSGRFPRTVSSVGPVQFSGLGPDESIARNNALSLAAEKAAQTMVDELNVRAVN